MDFFWLAKTGSNVSLLWKQGSIMRTWGKWGTCKQNHAVRGLWHLVFSLSVMFPRLIHVVACISI